MSECASVSILLAQANLFLDLFCNHRAVPPIDLVNYHMSKKSYRLLTMYKWTILFGHTVFTTRDGPAIKLTGYPTTENLTFMLGWTYDIWSAEDTKKRILNKSPLFLHAWLNIQPDTGYLSNIRPDTWHLDKNTTGYRIFGSAFRVSMVTKIM